MLIHTINSANFKFEGRSASLHQRIFGVPKHWSDSDLVTDRMSGDCNGAKPDQASHNTGRTRATGVLTSGMIMEVLSLKCPGKNPIAQWFLAVSALAMRPLPNVCGFFCLIDNVCKLLVLLATSAFQGYAIPNTYQSVHEPFLAAGTRSNVDVFKYHHIQFRGFTSTVQELGQKSRTKSNSPNLHSSMICDLFFLALQRCANFQCGTEAQRQAGPSGWDRFPAPLEKNRWWILDDIGIWVVFSTPNRMHRLWMIHTHDFISWYLTGWSAHCGNG